MKISLQSRGCIDIYATGQTLFHPFFLCLCRFHLCLFIIDGILLCLLRLFILFCELVWLLQLFCAGFVLAGLASGAFVWWMPIFPALAAVQAVHRMMCRCFALAAFFSFGSNPGLVLLFLQREHMTWYWSQGFFTNVTLAHSNVHPYHYWHGPLYASVLHGGFIGFYFSQTIFREVQHRYFHFWVGKVIAEIFF